MVETSVSANDPLSRGRAGASASMPSDRAASGHGDPVCARHSFCANDGLLTGTSALPIMEQKIPAPSILFFSGRAGILFACLSESMLAPDGPPHGGSQLSDSKMPRGVLTAPSNTTLIWLSGLGSNGLNIHRWQILSTVGNQGGRENGSDVSLRNVPVAGVEIIIPMTTCTIALIYCY